MVERGLEGLVLLMAVEPLRSLLDGNGTHLAIQLEALQIWLLHTVKHYLVPMVQSVSCGALVDPILLTQRTYNL